MLLTNVDTVELFEWQRAQRALRHWNGLPTGDAVFPLGGFLDKNLKNLEHFGKVGYFVRGKPGVSVQATVSPYSE